MLKFLISKFKESPGPFKKSRLIIGDLAEELFDIVDHYRKRPKTNAVSEQSVSSSSFKDSEIKPKSDLMPSSKNDIEKSKYRVVNKISKVETKLECTLDVAESLEKALIDKKNSKKQEFKVLAILWDAGERKMGTLSAKAMAKHGIGLGLLIRHENVRKVIKMRLGNYVDIMTEQTGNNRIYRYRLSEEGREYFESTYLN